MATRDDAVQAAQETGRIGLSTVLEGVATGIIEVGVATPVVAPLCVALQKAKGVVDKAKNNENMLKELHARCEMITLQVIDKVNASTGSYTRVYPLKLCVDRLKVLTERYEKQGKFARMIQFRRHGDDIQRLRADIEATVPIMGLAVAVTTADSVANIKRQVEMVRQMLVRLNLLSSRPAVEPKPFT